MHKNALSSLAPALFASQIACSEYNISQKQDPWPSDTQQEELPDPIQFNAGEIIESCFPGENISPINLETGALDDEAYNEWDDRTEAFRSRILDMAQSAHEDETISWEEITDGEVPFTVLAQRYSVLEPNFQYGKINEDGEHIRYLTEEEDWTWTTYRRLYIHFAQDHDPLEDFSISEGRDYTNPEVVRCSVEMHSPEFDLEEAPEADEMIAVRSSLDPLTLVDETEEDSLHIATSWHIPVDTGDFNHQVIGFNIGDALYDTDGNGEDDPVSEYSHAEAHTNHGIDFAEIIDSVIGEEGNHRTQTRSFPEQ